MTAPPCIADVGKLAALPAIGFPSGALAAGLAGDACGRSLVGAERFPVGTQWGVPCLVCGLDDLAQRQGGLPESAHPVCPLLGVPLLEPCQSAGIGQAGRCASGSRVVTHHHVQWHGDELRGVRPGARCPALSPRPGRRPAAT